MPHALIGQASALASGGTRRLDLHRRVAEAIEQASEPQSSPPMLAHHLLEAGSLVDREVRVRAGLAAGRHSLDIGAYEDAATWVERAGRAGHRPDRRSEIGPSWPCCAATRRGPRAIGRRGRRRARGGRMAGRPATRCCSPAPPRAG